ncbi:MAG: glutamate 5-kinase [Victivallaceae bacterium]|nr:glutamate 5-kinase [Victivallaceae bacterium]
MTQNRRATAFRSAKKIIVKAGTRLLIDRKSISALVSGIAALRDTGKEVLLVTSGAVGRGMEALKMTKRPRKLAEVQALAAIGQRELMAVYSEECRAHGFLAAQLLLTADDLRDRERYLNVMNCIHSLWDHGVLPIVNENDSVSVDELKFSDNDTLAAMLAALTGAELTLILTTEDGLRDRNADGSLGKRISVVEKISGDVKALAGGTDNGDFSIGGMTSKLRAAEIVSSSGATLWIVDGRRRDAISDVISGKDVGTLFPPAARKMPGRKRWLTFFSRPKGTLTVDDGAAEALRRGGKSLLPSGVRDVSGDFRRGDAVEVADEKGNVFARGLVHFSAAECRKILGKKSAEIRRILGVDADDEVIHRNHLTLL